MARSVTDRSLRPRAGIPEAWLIWAALLIVYIVWGSTYLAIRLVVESLPPFISASGRFLLAGTVLLVFLAARGGRDRIRVSRRGIASATIVGVALLTFGNGLVMVGEQSVPSGLAALIIAIVPLWVVVYRAMLRERVAAGTLVGVVVGFAGVGLLVASGGGSTEGDAPILLGLVLLVLAAASWAAGSVASGRLPLPADPLLSTALQMLTGGAALAVVGIAAGEPAALRPEAFTPAAVLSLAYLVVFGSLVAYTAYTWLLQHAPVSRVATYAYVNPVVAIALGVLIGEQVTVAMLAGAALVIGAVAIVIRTESVARSARAAAEAEGPSPGVAEETGAAPTAVAPGDPSAGPARAAVAPDARS